MNRSSTIHRRCLGKRAVAAMELAIAAPFLLMLLLVGADLTMFYENKYRVDNVAGAVGNMVSTAQALPLTAFPANFCSTTSATLNYFAIASQLASPLVVCGNTGATIISGISNSGGKSTISWQQRTGNAAKFPSLFGTSGGVPKFPSGYTVPTGRNVIVTEVYTGVSSWSIVSQQLLGTVGPQSLYAYSIFEPRSGTLLTPQ